MSPVVIFAIIILPLLLITYLVYRVSLSAAKRFVNNEETQSDSQVWLRNASVLEAEVISKEQTINPDAHGIAKVDLSLKIHTPDGGTVVTETVWLVEIVELHQLEPGSTVPVKFNPKRPKRVFPAVPWARAWLF
jgi:hypothetical protein